jgi:4-diphosphocytidyl-2-C-methyl-D-erythritol kinase
MMGGRVRVRSLAKINLDLRVLNKRPDGFHELRTIFQTVSLADTLEIECRSGPTRIEIKSNISIPGNIIEKAADSVLAATGKTARIGFVLKKRIPLGGGLGGGSSNAAAVLLALPVLLKKPLKMEKLMELAASLGSDVPFFLVGGTVVGLGRGTELYPIPDMGSAAALIITPGIHVSTGEAYRALGRGLAGESACPTSGDWGTSGDLATSGGWGTSQDQRLVAWNMSEPYENDFESVVFRQHSHLKLIKGKLLNLGARPALMSGSGSTIFGIFESRTVRDRAKLRFLEKFAPEQVHSVSLVRRSQYRAMWRRQLGGKLWQWQSKDRYAK